MADCEIFIENPDMTQLVDWIEARVGEMDWISENPELVVFHAKTGEDTLPILIHKQVEDTQFVSVWFNSTQAPWKSDADCARDAFKTLNCTVQCDPGDKIKGEQVFLEITEAGENLVNLSE